MKKLFLVGGGGHCKACIDVIEATRKYAILGILDHADKVGAQLLGYDYVGSDDDIARFNAPDVEFLVTVGQVKNADLRKQLFAKIISQDATLATVISPRAYVSRSATIGRGSIVMHDALVNAAAIVGENCIVNTKSLIEHDCMIGSHCHISTAAVLNGSVNIADGTFFGSNAVSRESVSAVASSFIKAGSCFKGNVDEK
jgi:sugar O-acyltransferase (sialic acid O-acetyltransferase NeuD family)